MTRREKEKHSSNVLGGRQKSLVKFGTLSEPKICDYVPTLTAFLLLLKRGISEIRFFSPRICSHVVLFFLQIYIFLIFFIHGIAAGAACFPVAEEDKRDNTDKMDKSDNRRQHRPK